MELVPVDWAQWSVNIISALLVGLTKAGFGAGAGLLAVPLMAETLGVENMLPTMLVLLIFGDICSIGRYPRAIDRRNAMMLIPGSFVGVGIGSALMFCLRRQGVDLLEAVLARFVGTVCIVFICIQLWRHFRESRLTESESVFRPRPWQGVGLGAAAGLTSTLCHAGGPLIALFLLPQKMGKRVFVGTTLTFFFVGNLTKLVPYTAQGMFTRPRLMTGIVLMPAVFIGTVVGAHLNRTTELKRFVVIIYAVAFLTGLKLLLPG